MDSLGGLKVKKVERSNSVWIYTKTIKTLTSVCVGLTVLIRFKVTVFPCEQARDFQEFVLEYYTTLLQSVTNVNDITWTETQAICTLSRF